MLIVVLTAQKDTIRIDRKTAKIRFRMAQRSDRAGPVINAEVLRLKRSRKKCKEEDDLFIYLCRARQK